MMKTLNQSFSKSFLLLFVFNFSLCFSTFAQQKEESFILPKTNSKSSIQQTIASTLIEVQYNRPNKKGRQLFGALIPYQEVWRTGADASTKITFSTPVTLNGVQIEAGTYELFTIPNPKEWEIILQKNTNQWGSYSYSQENDVARFRVKPISLSKEVETFTISFDEIRNNSGLLSLNWGMIQVPILITIDLKQTVIPQLEKALLSEKPPYFQAAMFYYENNIDLNRAKELISLALVSNKDHIGMLYRKALILKANGDLKEAIETAQKTYSLAQQAQSELKEEYSKLSSDLLKTLQSNKN